MTQTLIGSVTVGAGGAASIDFTGIPQTGFTDLLVVGSLRSNRASGVEVIKLQFNGSTTGYTDRHLIGFGSGAGYSETNSLGYISSYFANGNTTAANTFSSCGIYVPNYTVAANKSVSIDGAFEDNVAGAWQGVVAGRWSNSAAITSISLTPQYGTAWIQGSTASLYGIANTSNLYPKATGGVITSDGAYVYHTFSASDTFAATQAITADVLMIGGGGSPGFTAGGGGGAGGVLFAEAKAVSVGSYPVVIGAGGAAGPTDGSNGNTGGNTTAFGLTAFGGGLGTHGSTGGSTAGGSSGGVGYGTADGVASAATQTNQAGAIGYGNKGGDNYNGGAAPYVAAGGGGAGGIGANVIDVNNGGAGGIGLNNWASWTTVTKTGVSGYFAGGGGGSAGTTQLTTLGGLGGGGNGGYAFGYNAQNGVANTGGGGGGGSHTGTTTGGGSLGGSGIVIIRYPK